MSWTWSRLAGARAGRFRSLLARALVGGLLAAGSGGLSLGAADVDVEELLNRAQAADLQGDRTNALALVNEAIAAAPTNAQCYYVRARLHANHGERFKALADFDTVLALQPRAAEVYQFRGLEHLRLGHFDQALGDFDRYLGYFPRRAPFHWQRGVACYFAGRYEEARKQFELHHQVNSNDVENAAWHFAAVARAQGPAAARAALLPKVNDRRVPNAQVYGLLQGTLKPDDVLLAARAGQPVPAELKQRLFRAHYYIGLFYEASGEPALAREHIVTAAEQYPPPGYMGDLVRLHASLLRSRASETK